MKKKKTMKIMKDFDIWDYTYELFYKSGEDEIELQGGSSLDSKNFEHLDFNDLSMISKVLEIEIQRINVLIYDIMKKNEMRDL